MLARSQRLKKFFLLILFSFAAAAGLGVSAQQPALPVPPPDAQPRQLSPAAAYREALQPVEIARRSIANWSPIEQAVLGAAIKQATAACAAIHLPTVKAEELLDLSRLCSMGLNYSQSQAAARTYLDDNPEGAKRLLAYELEVDAALHLNDHEAAVSLSKELIEAAPTYTAEVSIATTETIDYLELLYNAQAIDLAAKRQALLLKTMQQPLAQDKARVAESLSPSELYRQANRLPELLQLKGDTDAAQATVADINRAVPPTIPSDDSIAIGHVRKRYALLGHPLPHIAITAALSKSKIQPSLPTPNIATALLLFPDWCAQCIRLAGQLPADPFSVSGHFAVAYGLLVQTVDPNPAPKKPAPMPTLDNEFAPGNAHLYLANTPSFLVAPDTLATFDAADFPLLILTDDHGIVRYITVADDSALQPGKTLDSAIPLIASPPTPATPVAK